MSNLRISEFFLERHPEPRKAVGYMAVVYFVKGNRL